MKNFNKLIQDRVNNSFDTVIKVTAVIAFLASVVLYNADLPVIYALLNFLTAVAMIFFSINSNKVKTSSKILSVIVVTFIISVASFIGGGFTSAFLTLLILSNLIAVLFLSQRQSQVVSGLSILLMFSLSLYTFIIDKSMPFMDLLVLWGLQINAFILFIVVLHISVNSMKRYLYENIVNLEKAMGETNRLAYYDQLTGLPNVHKFKIDIEKSIEGCDDNGFLVFLNLSSLSVINSTMGHDFGNFVIIETARKLSDLMEEDCLIARTGGNEFAIWIIGITEIELSSIFSTLLSELRSQSIVLSKKLEFYGGYTKFICNEDQLETCYRRATLALTHAKNRSMPEIVAYDSKLEKDIQRIEKLKDHVNQALEDNEFELYYQAKFDSRTEKVVGFEGLARWFSDDLGTVSPVEFIPVVESLNMANDFGEYIIERACMDYHELTKKFGDEITLSINVSPSHIMDSGIVDTLENFVRRYNIPSNKLILEITEDVMIDGIEDVKPILGALKALGVKISLDDFGTGYSSLNYLSQLELDELKIDKSFIDQLGRDKGSYVLLENIIHLSEAFNLDLVAEGIEHKWQCESLKEMGCHVIQGYYYAKPESLSDL